MRKLLTILAAALLSCVILAGCASGTGGANSLGDGTYNVNVSTDSNMFNAESGVLSINGDQMTCTIKHHGTGFDAVYMGSAEEAANADESGICLGYTKEEDLKSDGKYEYTYFDLPISALDEELACSGRSAKKGTWYDHTITVYSEGATQV